MATIGTIRSGLATERSHLADRRGGLRAFLTGLPGRIATMARKRRSRLALLELSDEQLRDIGISRVEAQKEGLRPFWQ